MDWVPLPFQELSKLATSKNSFHLDRANGEDREKLEAEAANVSEPDIYPGYLEEIRDSIGMVDAITVQTVAFDTYDFPDESLASQVRFAYRQFHWVHQIWFNGPACGESHSTTDIWYPGGRGFDKAVLVIESARSLTLVTLTGRFDYNGNVLRLRGHLGIPLFDACAISGLEKNRPAIVP